MTYLSGLDRFELMHEPWNNRWTIAIFKRWKMDDHERWQFYTIKTLGLDGVEYDSL